MMDLSRQWAGLIRYVTRRMLHAVLVIWAAFTGSFFLLFILPGDRALSRMGGDAGGRAFSAQDLAVLRHEMGLDQPAAVQYAKALWRVLHADFGISSQTGGDALAMFLNALPETLKLASVALVLTIGLGAGWAVTTVLVRSPPLKSILTTLPAIGVSIPAFWVGLLFLNLFAFQWKLLPAMGNEGWQTLILPAIVLAIPSASVIAELMTQNLSSAMASSYVEVARSHGVSHAGALFKHAVRNASIPVVTVLGVIAGHMIAGSVVVESVFSRAGIGLLAVKAVTYQDTPLVLVTIVFSAFVYVTTNFLVDLLYPFLDPRIGINIGDTTLQRRSVR